MVQINCLPGCIQSELAVTTHQHEKDVTYESQQTNICFYEDDDFDYIHVQNRKEI